MVRRTGTAGAIMLLLAAAALPPGVASAQPPRCKAGKVWYAGSCRYPEDAERMKAADEARRRAQQEKEAAEAEARRLELEQQKDAGACEMARASDTRDAWQAYLDQFAEGDCRAEAAERIAALEAEPPEPPPPEPSAPAPQPPPPAPAAAPLPPPLPSHVFPEAIPPPPADNTAQTVAIVSFVAAGAGLVTAAVAGPIALVRSRDLEKECPNGQCSCPAGDDGCVSKHKTLERNTLVAAHTATAGFVLLGVGAAVGTIVLLASGASHEQALAPLLAPGFAGLRARF